MLKKVGIKAVVLGLIFISFSFAEYVNGTVSRVRSYEDQDTHQQYINIQFSNGNNYYFELKGRPIEDMWLSQVMLAQAKPSEIDFWIDRSSDTKTIHGRTCYRVKTVNTHLR